MSNGYLGLIGLIIGLSVLTGGQTIAPGANTTVVGGIILAGSLVLAALAAWEGYAGKRLKLLGKETAAAQIERLALLREQGRLTEEEFASSKQRILGDDDDEAETPATDADVEVAHLAQLARLKTQGVLTDEEFVTQKQAILLEASLKRLNRLYVEKHLSQEEYLEQKEKLLREGVPACSGPAGPEHGSGGRG